MLALATQTSLQMSLGLDAVDLHHLPSLEFLKSWEVLGPFRVGTRGIPHILYDHRTSIDPLPQRRYGVLIR